MLEVGILDKGGRVIRVRLGDGAVAVAVVVVRVAAVPAGTLVRVVVALRYGNTNADSDSDDDDEADDGTNHLLACNGQECRGKQQRSVLTMYFDLRVRAASCFSR